MRLRFTKTLSARTAAIVAIAGLSSGSALAATTMSSGHMMMGSKSLSAMDRAFLTKAVQTDLAEISAGRVAMTKGTTQTVRLFGKRMVDTHTAARAKDAMLASSFGVTPPTTPSSAQRAAAARVNALTGTAYDRAYLQLQVAGHTKADHLFRSEISSGSNATVVAAAKKGLGLIDHHLQLATMDQQRMMAGGAMGGNAMHGAAMGHSAMGGAMHGSSTGGAMNRGSMPGGSTSGGSMPGGSTNGSSTSGGSMPGGSTSGGSMPGGSTSGGSASGTSGSGTAAGGASSRGTAAPAASPVVPTVTTSSSPAVPGTMSSPHP